MDSAPADWHVGKDSDITQISWRFSAEHMRFQLTFSAYSLALFQGNVFGALWLLTPCCGESFIVNGELLHGPWAPADGKVYCDRCENARGVAGLEAVFDWTKHGRKLVSQSHTPLEESLTLWAEASNINPLRSLLVATALADELPAVVDEVYEMLSPYLTLELSVQEKTAG